MIKIIIPKRLRRIILILIFPVGIFNFALAQDFNKSKVLKISAAVPKEFPPYYHIDKKGNPAGFAIDLMDRVSALAKIKINYLIEDSWSDVSKAIKSGRAILIPNIGINDTRNNWLDYTDPVETFSIRIFIRRQTQNIKAIDDLAGRKVAAVKFNVAVELLKKYKEIDTQVYDYPDNALFALLSGNVDAFVYPAPVFYRIARKADIEDRFKIIGEPLKEIKRAVGMAKGNTQLIERINRAINQFIGTEDYRQIYVKWFGKPKPFWTISTAVIFMGAMMLFLFFFMALWRHFGILKLNRELLTTIDRLKQSEKALQKNEEILKTIFEANPDPVVVYDANEHPLYLNSAFTKIFGWSLNELKGRRIPFVPQDQKEITQLKIKEIHEFGNSVQFETKRLSKHGKVVDILLSAATINDLLEINNGLVVNLKDITDIKKLENQLHQAQKMESVGRLAGGVAHDYNNTLGVIIGFTELAMDTMDPTEPLRTDLNEILIAAEHAADITRQLLAFARKQPIAPKVLNLNENVESLLKMLRHLIGEDINLVWLPGASLWPVKMDPTQFDQILVNLCVNARDAVEDVGKITIETGTVVFDAAYCADHIGFIPGEFVKLTVSDNGTGMDKEILDNIFEPFFTTKGVDKGTGLGLSMVYGIVKQNNGFINVYSEPGTGTAIKLYLPRHEGKVVEIQRESTTEIPIGLGETILLVEDDLTILKLTRKILNGLGYTVLASGTPKEAMRLAGEHSGKIHLLVTDIIMPGMNGRELAERLQSISPDLKCMFMSGYTANTIAHHGVLDEGVHFIQKPFSKKDLAKTVRKALDEDEN